MDQATHNKIVSFIWGIADDVLRDLFKRGKYPDVILPMSVLRRMDAVLEPTKKAVLETKQMLDHAGITEQRAALAAAAGQSFAAALDKRLAEWGNDDEEEESGDGAAKKGLPEKKKRKLLDARTWERDARLVETATQLRQELGGDLFEDHNIFRDRVDNTLKKLDLRLSAPDLKLILRAVSWRVETAPPVIAKVHKPGKAKTDPLRGFFPLERGSASRSTAGDSRALRVTDPRSETIVEYEPDPDLRDTEQVPLLEPGGIEAFIRREVLPYTPDAWIKEDATKIGYEISFTRHFYQPQPLRTLDAIRADILAVEKEAEGVLDELLQVKS